MLILQMCALSSVVLLPSTKLLNLLYPIPGKGLANHLLEVNAKAPEHHEALKPVSHPFGLEEFGDNGDGTSLLCETLPGRNVWDFFPLGVSISFECIWKTYAKEVRYNKMDPSQ